jgi:hypothetical protein
MSESKTEAARSCALSSVVFEGISGNQYELSAMFPRRPNCPSGGGEALFTHAGSRTAHVGRLHAQLPVCGVNELHCLVSPHLADDLTKESF